MIKNELKALWHNKLMIIVLLAIILIPAMYSGFFLASMWDPYGELDNLPVAVVNNDKAVTYNEKELKVGENLADSLEENDSMAFNVVDADTAKTGLENGTYYMVITIPENFSENASTVMDDNPQKMKLFYQTNPGKNYISMKLTESAIKQIKENINAEVTKTYTETVFDSLDDVVDGFADAVDGTVEMVDGEDDLIDGNEKITDNLGTLADGSQTLSDGLGTLQDGIKSYTDGASQINEGLITLNDGIGTLSKDAVSGAGDLKDGAGDLKDGVKDYTSGVQQAKDGTEQLVENNNALNTGVKQLSEGMESLNTGSGKLLGGLKEIQSGLNTNLTQDKVDSINALADTALPTISSGIQQLNQALDTVDLSGLNQLSTAVTGLTTANQYVGSANQDLATAIAAIEGSTTMSATEKQQLKLLLGGASMKLQGVESGITTVSTGLSTAVDPTLLTKVDELKSGVKSLNDSTVYLTYSASALSTMVDSSTTIQTAMNNLIVPGMEEINGGIATAKNGIDGDEGLKNGISNYTAGVKKVDKGLGKLVDNNKKLNTGVKDLFKGTGTLFTGLDKGVNKLSDGTNKLLDGSNELVGNNSTLKNGTNDLINGANDITDGAGKLKDGSEKLGDGLTTLSDGTQELQDGLTDGKNQVEDSKASDDSIDMFVEPVETSGSSITTVENNGHAMAAYMMSVGLWVACLAFCLMYPLSKYTGKLTSGFDWWASKAVILYPMGFLMDTLLMVILHYALGFNPVDMTKTWLIGMATTACFLAIMYFFNLLLGKVGSFLMLLFMVLQLAGSAGTYPLEVSGPLANALHKWVPFTYSVDAFRSSISGGASVSYEITVLLVIAAVFTVMTIVVFGVRSRFINKDRRFVYEWLESKGLA